MTAETSLGRVLGGAQRCVFLSPHLDDVAFSCGALLRAVAAGAGRGGGNSTPLVATVFTAALAERMTLAARRSLRAEGREDVLELYEERRAEDVAVLRPTGAEVLHLGFVDAPFRRRPGRLAQRLGRLLPELGACYPTFRFDIARGRVSGADRPLALELAARLTDLLRERGATHVVAPLGVGRHVDHLLVREAARRAATRTGAQLVLYADYPYCLHHPVPETPGWGGPWRPQVWEHDLAAKAPLIAGYRTQTGLFSHREAPIVAERYLVPAQVV